MQQSNKQMKLIPFPSQRVPEPEADMDVAMSDCTMDIDMDFTPPQFHARRLSSSASSASTDSELSLRTCSVLIYVDTHVDNRSSRLSAF